MNAPATPRIPTPGDLARRIAGAAPTPRPGTATDTVAPGHLRSRETMRPLYQQAIRISRMTPESRLVALTLLGYANWRSGLLNKYQPSPSQIAYATGLAEPQVQVHLKVLTQRGWLTRRTLATGPRTGQPVYQLCIPQFALAQIRSRQLHS